MTNSSQITLKQLRYFARIVEFGSISRASQELHTAQTALGLQVRALEESLGTGLLLRHPKGVKATEQGQFVYERALEILRSVDDLVERLHHWADGKPEDIWLGLPPNLINAIGTQILVKQGECMPGINLHLQEGSRNDQIEDIQNGNLNWAIVHEAREVEGCHFFPILRQSVHLVCRPGTDLPPGQVRLHDVLARDLVLDSGRRVIPSVLAGAARSLGLKPRIKYEVDSISAIKHMILSENVSGLFNHLIVRDEIERGELEAHRVVDPPLEITAYFVCRAQELPGAKELPALLFIDQLLDELVDQYPGVEVRLGHLTAVVRPPSEPARLQAKTFSSAPLSKTG